MTTNTGSWLPVPVSVGRSDYRKYKSEDVIIVSRGNTKNRKIYIPTKVWTALRTPTKIAIFERGSNIALANADEIVNNVGNTLIVQTSEEIDYYVFISGAAMSKGRSIQEGVYTISYVQGMAVFDTSEKPSLP